MSRLRETLQRYFWKRFRLERYLNASVVMVIDLAVSLFSSAVALFMAQYLLGLRTLSFHVILYWFAGSLVFSFLFFKIFKTHHLVIRHSTLRELARVSAAGIGKGLGLLALFAAQPACPIDSRFVGTLLIDVVVTFALLVLVRILMVVVYNYVRERSERRKNCKKVLIYGTDEKSVSLVTRLQNSPHYRIAGFIVYSPGPVDRLLADHPVFYFSHPDQVKKVQDIAHADAVIFALDADARAEQDRLIDYATHLGLQVLLAPTIEDVTNGKRMRKSIREIRIEDLLGREEIHISLEAIKAQLSGKTVMVTGAAGSIGSELCRQLAGFGIAQLVLFDNAETPMHYLRLELEERFPTLSFVPLIGDVRSLERLDYAFRNFHPQVVFHAAAYKHVPLMEENPCEAVLVNVLGSRYVADKCLEYRVEKMVMISTDKAVNPTNVMGCSKRIAEMYVQSLGREIENGALHGTTQFVTTRFGNVLGSNGSVIPHFREQIAKGGPVTVTHKEITRFFMTIPEACRLVMEAATLPIANRIVVFDMGESVKIDDLARRMITLAGYVPDVDIQVTYTGLRPGEKLYEEVLATTENTLPTAHERIRIAQVRPTHYGDILAHVSTLATLARTVQIDPMVRLMKQIVPEFHSNNSRFEEMDISNLNPVV